MLPPQKSWELGSVNQRSLPSVPNGDGLQSSATNLGSYAPSTQLRSTFRSPPPLPPRPRQSFPNSFASGYGNSGYYNSPFSYGGYGSSIGNYGYNGYSNHTNYGTYGYGGYGINRMGFPHTMPENRFLQMAEDGARPAFQSIESLVHAVSSVSFMLESTFNAMYSSFRAVLGVAENFGRLRALFGQFLSVFAVFRWLRWLYKKCLFILGLCPNDPGREQLWQQASEGVMGSIGVNADAESQRTSWPIMVYLGIILSGPYLMWKLLSSIEVPKIDPCKIIDWKNCKEPGYSAIVLYDFSASSPQDLNLRAGQKILIAPRDCQQSQNWLYATVDKKKVGFVPANYIKMVGRVIFQEKKSADSELSACQMSEVSNDSSGETEATAESNVPVTIENEAPGDRESTESSNTE